jgi:dUTP pyrophosphatase
MYTLYLYTEDAELRALYKHKQAQPFKGDAGVDLFVPTTIELDSTHPTYFVDHRIICRMTRSDSNESVSYYLYPRSSISKTPLRLANSVGIIDSGYRGPIIAALDFHSASHPYVVDSHSRLVQICSPTLSPIQLVVCDHLSEMDIHTDRGSNGFGSSGN